jgi:hypothetical protein
MAITKYCFLTNGNEPDSDSTSNKLCTEDKIMF